MNKNIIKKFTQEIRNIATNSNQKMIGILWDYFLCHFLYGFSFRDYKLSRAYQLKNALKALVLTHKRWIKLVDTANLKDDVDLVLNKHKFALHFRDYYGRDFIYPQKAGFEDFCKFIKSHNNVLQKPLNGNQAKGIKKVVIAQDNLLEEYNRMVEDDVLLEEIISQHPAMAKVGKSVNTIRVYSIYTGDKSVAIIKALMRAGTGDSLVDNFHAGGIFYPIDLKSGVIVGKGINFKYEQFINHPGYDFSLIGMKIPFWEEVSEIVTKAHCLIPNLRYIGWDIAITDDGPVIIEANHDADHEMLEFIGEERFFYKKIKNYLK